MELSDVLKKLAPTAASLLAGPFAGMAVEYLGSALNISEPTLAKVEKAITGGNLNGDQLAAIKLAEQQVVIRLEELGVRREELVIEDRKDARKNNVEGGVQKALFWLSILILSVAFGAEIRVLFWGYPKEIVDAIIVGRILGLLDSVALQVMAYWYGTTNGSARSKELLAQSAPVK